MTHFGAPDTMPEISHTEGLTMNNAGGSLVKKNGAQMIYICG